MQNLTMTNWRFPCLLLMTVLLLSACQQSGQGSHPDVVRIGTFSEAIDYAPYMVAKSKGWFEEAFEPFGAEIEYTTFQSLAPINESLATNRLDIIFEAEPPAIIGKAGGNDVRIMEISCSLTQEIIVRDSASVRSIPDLSGKKIAVSVGSSSHYGLLKIAKDAGLNEDAFEVIDMTPRDAKIAFQTNQVDGWAVWPPWPEQELVPGNAFVLPGGDAQINSIMALRGGFVDTFPEITRAAIGVIERAKSWLVENPEEAQRIIAAELGLELPVVELAWPKHKWDAELTESVIADIQAKADFLFQRGLVETSVDVRGDLVRPLED